MCDVEMSLRRILIEWYVWSLEVFQRKKTKDFDDACFFVDLLWGFWTPHTYLDYLYTKVHSNIPGNATQRTDAVIPTWQTAEKLTAGNQ